MNKKEDPVVVAGSDTEQKLIDPIIAQLDVFLGAYINRMGKYCFPIVYEKKIPMTPNGYQDEVLNCTSFRDLTKGRLYNIGWSTGSKNGFWVLDLDPKHGGLETYQHLLAQYGSFGATWQVRTQSGGTHFYYKWDPKFPIGNRANVLPGMDVRGQGGYVLAPPSKVEGSYEWVRSPSQADLLPPPEWLWTVLNKSSSQRDDADFSRYANGIEDGQRNESFTKIIGTLLGRGVDMHLAWALITSYNLTHCQPPLEEDELLKTFRSIASREISKRQRRQRKWGA